MSANGHAALPEPVVAVIKEAGLRFVTDASPGITRAEKGGVVAYLDAEGRKVKDKEVLARIKSLVIPPAWQQVWICRHENGHIQATGRDARGRKQYRYHPRWREVRDSNKFDKLALFARVLPRIRRQVERDLKEKGMPRRKVLAAVVRLLEQTLIRVGNEEYARQNHSFGLTTLRNRHVDVRGSGVVFSFRGKSGKQHKIRLEDPQLAKVVRRCQDMPGQDLFAFEDDAGGVHPIGSQDVNDYLREAAGDEVTAKDFRTWGGTVLAAMALRELGIVTTAGEAKKNVVMAIEATAVKLGNTPTVCRKCYVHPLIISSYLEGVIIEGRTGAAASLKAAEKAVIKLLKQAGNS